MEQIEYRAVIKFLTKQGKSPPTIMDEMSAVYGDHCPGKTMVYKWHGLFKLGRESIEKSESAGKLMATVFWDCQGILLIDYKEKGVTITGEYYARLLERLRQCIKEKRRGKLAKGVLLLQDNAPVHKSRIAMAALSKCGFENLDHPPYSPDLAPSDYYLFPNLKRELRGRKFHTDDEVKDAISAHFDTKIENYFFVGLEKLISRSSKCIDLKEDYIEKEK